MSTSLNSVSDFLTHKGIHHQLEEERQIIIANWKMPTAGDLGLNVVFDLQEEGEFLSISAIRVAECPLDDPNLAAVLQVMAEATWRTKMVRWEYDGSDGEIRASVHIPMEDASLTEAQLYRALGALLQMCGRYVPALSVAQEKGIADLDELLNNEKESSYGDRFLYHPDEALNSTVEIDVPPDEEVDGWFSSHFRGGDEEPLN